MSLFSRIASRAGRFDGARASPKGMGFAARAADAAAAPEEEEAPADAPRLARVATAEDDKKAAPLRRVARAPKPEEEPAPAQALRRAAAPAEAEAPKEEEPTPAQPLRRVAAKAPEAEEGTLPRAAAPESPAPESPAPEPEDKPAARAVAHRATPAAEALDAENSPKPAKMSAEPDPPPARMLRRFQAPAPATGFAPSPGFAHPIGAEAAPGFEAAPDAATPPAFWQAPAQPGASPDRAAEVFRPDPKHPDAPFAPERRTAASERPRVVIEQIDVTIHDAAPAPASNALADLNRALRSRYLGG